MLTFYTVSCIFKFQKIFFVDFSTYASILHLAVIFLCKCALFNYFPYFLSIPKAVVRILLRPSICVSIF